MESRETCIPGLETHSCNAFCNLRTWRGLDAIPTKAMISRNSSSPASHNCWTSSPPFLTKKYWLRRRHVCFPNNLLTLTDEGIVVGKKISSLQNSIQLKFRLVWWMRSHCNCVVKENIMIIRKRAINEVCHEYIFTPSATEPYLLMNWQVFHVNFKTWVTK